ncbi:DDE-type integrase/transposase/recombinase [Bradyrhizobium liaoningense]|uniref:DDE-type integrase/transposase/recombinase n=1 Tax=Bradyrhizobium liaoningense TaxID=43992 RepID=UPI001BAE2CC5|nr:DDE-type integrase/transposase/recombinase [Bradyrhizobium liaoningense]MBR0708000.1 DDE-type integrase/transposase/recombinase [Bradyrhizobium liaoningense]
MAKLRIQPPAPQPLPTQGPRKRFGRFDRIVIDEVEYMFRDAVGDTITLAHANNADAIQVVTQAQLHVLRHSRGYRHDRDYYNPEVARARINAGVQFLSDLPEEEQADILWMQRWCLIAIRMRGLGYKHGGISFSDDGLKKTIPEIAKEINAEAKAEVDGGKKPRTGRVVEVRQSPCPSTLLGWINDLIEGNMNPLALRKEYRKCGNRTPRLTPEEYAYLWQYARMAATPEKPDGTVLWRNMSAAISEENIQRRSEGRPELKVPSYDRLLEEIDQIPFFDMKAGQLGPEKAKNLCRAVNHGLVDVIRPLQRVEFDEWTVHLHILLILTGVWVTLTDKQKKLVERVRLVLCLAIDVATKCVVGMSLARAACPENALRCLEMAVSDKQEYADAAGAVTPWDMCGTMESAVADAGTSFANLKFRTRTVDLGVQFKTTVAGVPFLRGTVERVFRSTDDKFIALFSGRTFSDSVEKGDYDSEGRACLTVDEFAEALVRYKIDHYHNHPHDGLGGEAPRPCWRRLTEEYGVDPPPDDHLRRIVFGLELSVVLGAHGLRVLGIDYQSGELNDLFCRRGPVRVDVRVDLGNLGGISAKIGDDWLLVEGAPELYRVTAKDWIAVWDEFQARNAAVNAITAGILNETMAHLVKIGRIARERMNIATEPMSQGELQYHHRRMSIGVKFVKEAADEKATGPRDLFDGALVVGAAPSDSAAEDSEPLCEEVVPQQPARTGKQAERPDKQAPPTNKAERKKERRAHWKFEE